MVHMNLPLSNNIQLEDRLLWPDGDSSYTPDNIIKLIYRNGNTENIFTTEMTDDIKQFNSLVSDKNKIKIKETVKSLDFSWNIPDEFKDINVKEYVLEKFSEECHKLNVNIDNNPDFIKKRLNRIVIELKLFEEKKALPVIKTLIYIINILESNEIVWGVGRGSSVSSYVLYLIGIHDIDSVEYDIDIADFLH